MKNIRQVSGFTLLEALIALGILAIVASLSVGGYLSYLRSAETVDAIATIAVVREQVGVTANRQEPVTCDDTMVRKGDLENPYMDLAMVSVVLDPANAAQGASPGLAITARVDTHGPQGLVATRLLLEELQGQGASIVDPVLKDSFVSFSVVLNEIPICNVASIASIVQPPAQAPTLTPGQIPNQAPAQMPTPTPAQAPTPSVTGVQALSPPTTFSTAEAQVAHDIVSVGMNDPVFAGAIADALAKAQLSGGPVSLPGSPEAAATLVKCNIPTPTPCKDNYIGDCQADFPGMCTDPVRACAAARICPKACGYCQGVSPEMQAFLDQAFDNLLQTQNP